MRPWIAKFVLLVACVGQFAPPLLAINAPAAHSCCVRKAARHCAESGGADSSVPELRDPSCCGRACARAATTARWAYPQPAAGSPYAANTAARLETPSETSLNIEVLDLRSGRAPPSS